MNRIWVFVALMGWAATLLGSCSNIHVVPGGAKTAHTLAELKADDAQLLKAWASERKEDLLVKIDQGQTLNLKLVLQTPIVSLNESPPASITAERDFYLLISKNGMLMVSPDGERFASLDDFKEIKKLFDGKSGSVGIGFGISSTDGPHLSFTLELK